jgi:hypothetical protein
MLSEFNDFPKIPDDNSYESCLKAIKKADYFVLLIGARTGGWYDEKNRVSITRMEYRAALESFQKTGKPKLAIFVRQNLWDIREDRNALLRHIKADHTKLRELDDAAKDQLANHPSRFVNDADAAFDFLHEVGQVEQMKAAVVGSAVLPKANWIHLFSQFGDVAAALRIAFGVTTHVERKILLENLKNELLQNLCHLMTKDGHSGIMPLSDWARSSLNKITSSYDEDSTLQVSDLSRLAIFELIASRVPNVLTTRFLEQAAKSGVFMGFDSVTGQYKSTEAHQAVIQLLTLIPSLSRLSMSAQRIATFWNERGLRGKPRTEQVTVPNTQIAGVLGEAKILRRIIDFSVALSQFLNGSKQPFGIPEKWCPAPFADEAEKIMEEEIQMEDIIGWMNGVARPSNEASK